MIDNDEELGNVGDLIGILLSTCYSPDTKPTLERRIRELGTTFEQGVAAAIAGALYERFLFLPKDLPGIPKRGRPVELLRAAGHRVTAKGRFPLFISYRIDDSRPHAERIFDTLRVEFGANATFKDTTAMPLGGDYRQAIRTIIEECEVVIVVIGAQWLKRGRARKSPRLFDANDDLRLEIEAALATKKPIIPVLIGGAIKPNADQLPKSIRGLLRHTFFTVRSDPDYGGDMSLLIDACRSYLAPDIRYVPMLIPDLPLNSRLPVRVLAGSAHYLRALFLELGNGKPMREIMEQHGDLLVKCEKVIDHWCDHFGIPENDEIQPSPQPDHGRESPARARSKKGT